MTVNMVLNIPKPENNLSVIDTKAAAAPAFILSLKANTSKGGRTSIF